MKYLLRILTALVTFLIALNFTWFVYKVTDLNGFNKDLTENCETFCLLPKLKSLTSFNSKGEVKVKFINFTEKDNNLYAEFEVTNNSPNSIYYTDKWKDINSIPRISVDGVEIEKEPVFRCGNGLISFHIHSGDSMKVRVFSHSFEPFINRQSKLKMGFDYYTNSNKSDKIYWSQEFEIPESIKAKIRKEIAKFNLAKQEQKY